LSTTRFGLLNSFPRWGYPSVLAKDIRLAAQLAGKIDARGVAPINGGHWRFFRTLFIYTEARAIADILDRIHQYCRCIDGLILPDVGKTKAQFKYRTELFIGPRHHDLIGEIYDVGSAVEHLHENRYLESFDRQTRLDLLKKEAITEHIARSAIARIVGDSNLWPHFAAAFHSAWVTALFIAPISCRILCRKSVSVTKSNSVVCGGGNSSGHCESTL
jgi:hypothetical protein